MASEQESHPPLLRCRRCGYDVESLVPSDAAAEFRCPECGTTWTRDGLTRPPLALLCWRLIWLPCVAAFGVLVVGWVLADGNRGVRPSIIHTRAVLAYVTYAPIVSGLIAGLLLGVRLRIANALLSDTDRIPVGPLLRAVAILVLIVTLGAYLIVFTEGVLFLLVFSPFFGAIGFAFWRLFPRTTK